MGARFRVRLVCEVFGRTLLTGQVLDGNLIAGLATPPVKIPGGPQCELTVEAVELGLDPSDTGSTVGIRFAQSPSTEDLALLFPPGTVVTLEAPVSQKGH
jgi:hypothetical protein